MSGLFLSSHELDELRQRQQYLRSVISEFVHAPEHPYPSIAGWPVDSRRLLEITIRRYCADEGQSRSPLIDRLDTIRSYRLIERAIDTETMPGTPTGWSRTEAVEILRSVMPTAPALDLSDEEAAALSRLDYLLEVADRCR